MKKCPSCYAIMRESTTRTEVPALQQKPTDGPPEVSRSGSDMSVANVVTRKSRLRNRLRLRGVDDPF